MSAELTVPIRDLASTAVTWGQALCVLGYACTQTALLVYSSHRWSMLFGLARRSRPSVLAGPATELPRVTVQLPVFNEPRVIERLIRSVAALDYPRDRLEIQVLDDSTDETTAIAAVTVDHVRLAGVDARLLHRDARDGFKAGALAAGLRVARGEWIAVFDADFLPPPGFLRDLVPHFADPRVGMVQARWGHLNRDRSWMTAAQATLLDAHFLLEHVVRQARGHFFNFNGTAGVWRRACIEDAGGWSHDTLTEDLDLSYRAQLRGWRFVFDPTVVAPAELPANIEAFKSQQRRWAKGSIQTARKLLAAVWTAPLPRAAKWEAVFHLTSNAAYPLLLLLGGLMMPVMFGEAVLPAAVIGALHLAVLAFGLVPVAGFLAAGAMAAGRPAWRVPGDVLAALVYGIGLSANNARAVLEGLRGEVGDWERTPKTGDLGAGVQPIAGTARGRRARAGGVEWSLAAYGLLVTVLALRLGQLHALPFLALLVIGFAAVGLASWRAFGMPAGPGELARE